MPPPVIRRFTPADRDAVIAKALAEHGRAGVPLYLMYGTNGGEPVLLPQILTPGIVL